MKKHRVLTGLAAILLTSSIVLWTNCDTGVDPGGSSNQSEDEDSKKGGGGGGGGSPVNPAPNTQDVIISGAAQKAISATKVDNNWTLNISETKWTEGHAVSLEIPSGNATISGGVIKGDLSIKGAENSTFTLADGVSALPGTVISVANTELSFENGLDFTRPVPVVAAQVASTAAVASTVALSKINIGEGATLVLKADNDIQGENIQINFLKKATTLKITGDISSPTQLKTFISNDSKAMGINVVFGEQGKLGDIGLSEATTIDLTVGEFSPSSTLLTEKLIAGYGVLLNSNTINVSKEFRPLFAAGVDNLNLSALKAAYLNKIQLVGNAKIIIDTAGDVNTGDIQINIDETYTFPVPVELAKRTLTLKSTTGSTLTVHGTIRDGGVAILQSKIEVPQEKTLGGSGTIKLDQGELAVQGNVEIKNLFVEGTITNSGTVTADTLSIKSGSITGQITVNDVFKPVFPLTNSLNISAFASTQLDHLNFEDQAKIVIDTSNNSNNDVTLNLDNAYTFQQPLELSGRKLTITGANILTANVKLDNNAIFFINGGKLDVPASFAGGEVLIDGNGTISGAGQIAVDTFAVGAGSLDTNITVNQAFSPLFPTALSTVPISAVKSAFLDKITFGSAAKILIKKTDDHTDAITLAMDADYAFTVPVILSERTLTINGTETLTAWGRIDDSNSKLILQGKLTVPAGKTLAGHGTIELKADGVFAGTGTILIGSLIIEAGRLDAHVNVTGQFYPLFPSTSPIPISAVKTEFLDKIAFGVFAEIIINDGNSYNTDITIDMDEDYAFTAPVKLSNRSLVITGSKRLTAWGAVQAGGVLSGTIKIPAGKQFDTSAGSFQGTIINS